jgi:S1-C subfamily serine protease
VIRFLMICVAALVPAVSASAQSTREDSVLSRRGWFGVALGPHENGVLVTGLAAGSPAAEAGIRAGDVIRTIDNAAVRKPEDVTQPR